MSNNWGAFICSSTNNLRGKVVCIDPSEPLRPTIELIDTGDVCSLRDDRTLHIDHLYKVT